MMIIIMNCFCGLVDRQKAFGTIVPDPRNPVSPTRLKQDLNLRRTLVQALLNEVVQ